MVNTNVSKNEQFKIQTIVLFIQLFSQWAKSAKSSLKRCVFVNSALKIKCHIVKLQTAFSVILPTEIKLKHNVLREYFFATFIKLQWQMIK